VSLLDPNTSLILSNKDPLYLEEKNRGISDKKKKKKDDDVKNGGKKARENKLRDR